MPHRIAGVLPGSVADRLGIQPSDVLREINGEEPVDYIDYQALTAQEEMRLTLDRDGKEMTFAFTKSEYQPLGLQFETQLMSPMRTCANRCVFCFVDQLPAGSRETLRVKDDDWRLSLMMGCYVTLTNVSDAELARIIERRASPLYISVHSTDAALRSRMMGRAKKDRLMEQLNALVNAGIEFHTQAVLCPGLNDGAALEKTIEDLAALAPNCRSLALVPVGLTARREALYPIEPYDAQSAQAVVALAEGYQAKFLDTLGTRFVFPSDEFYLTGGQPILSDEEYEDYDQIENGVGLLRLLATEFEIAYDEADLSAARPAKLAIATGHSAAPFLQTLIERFPIPCVSVSVHALDNHHFGETVTVAGLLTGSDLTQQMRGVAADAILITECMLRDGEDVFLDGMTLLEAEERLQTRIVPVGRRGEDLLSALMRG